MIIEERIANPRDLQLAYAHPREMIPELGLRSIVAERAKLCFEFGWIGDRTPDEVNRAATATINAQEALSALLGDPSQPDFNETLDNPMNSSTYIVIGTRPNQERVALATSRFLDARGPSLFAREGNFVVYDPISKRYVHLCETTQGQEILEDINASKGPVIAWERLFSLVNHSKRARLTTLCTSMIAFAANLPESESVEIITSEQVTKMLNGLFERGGFQTRAAVTVPSIRKNDDGALSIEHGEVYINSMDGEVIVDIARRVANKSRGLPYSGPELNKTEEEFANIVNLFSRTYGSIIYNPNDTIRFPQYERLPATSPTAPKFVSAFV